MSVLHVWSTITLLICSFLCDGIRGQDEPGFRNGKQQLQGMEHMTPAQWEDFKKRRLSEC